jgi:hypothetical protein
MKSVDDFNRNRATKDGLQYECKECSRARITRHYYAKKAALSSEEFRDWMHDKNLRKKYRLSLSQYQVLCEKQHYCCALCGRWKPLQVDHNHITGKVRGLLCIDCNTSLGKLSLDSVDATTLLLTYLQGSLT